MVSSGVDRYSAMARVSVASVRLSNPGAKVELYVDRLTFEAMHAKGDALLKEVDVLSLCDDIEDSPAARSRFVKTKAAIHVRRPVLLLDCDTLIRGKLASLTNLDHDVAACVNHSSNVLAEQLWSQDQDIGNAMGWAQTGRPYFNTGVLWLNDTLNAGRLALRWHELWKQSYGRTNDHRDQPAFNEALRGLSLDLEILPNEFNAQLMMAPGLARTAVIWHIYSSVGLEAKTDYRSLIDDISWGGRLTYRKVGRLMRDPAAPFARRPLGGRVANRCLQAMNKFSKIFGSRGA